MPRSARASRRALEAPRALIARLLAGAPQPAAGPGASRRCCSMAAHRAYLLDTFGDGRAAPGARRDATRALEALWERLLA